VFSMRIRAPAATRQPPRIHWCRRHGVAASTGTTRAGCRLPRPAPSSGRQWVPDGVRAPSGRRCPSRSAHPRARLEVSGTGTQPSRHRPLAQRLPLGAERRPRRCSARRAGSRQAGSRHRRGPCCRAGLCRPAGSRHRPSPCCRAGSCRPAGSRHRPRSCRPAGSRHRASPCCWAGSCRRAGPCRLGPRRRLGRNSGLGQMGGLGPPYKLALSSGSCPRSGFGARCGSCPVRRGGLVGQDGSVGRQSIV
jgi:hypothetical protein